MSDDPNAVLEYELSELVTVALNGDVADEYDYDFIMNMSERFSKGTSFSDNQVEFTHTLYARYT